jgi:Dyp-type peroxidase family
MINLSQPLDLDDIHAPTFLQNLQGNIIKGHGRNFTAHLIIKLIGNVPAARQWIASFAKDILTTAYAAKQMTQAWKADEATPGEPFFMFLLSAEGYRSLGLAEDDLPRPYLDSFSNPADDNYFKAGMKRQAGNPRSFPDPPPTQWEAPYQGDIHAMILLADDSLQRLEHSLSEINQSISGIFEVLTVERGGVLLREFPRGVLVVEHFGFQDGISQPLMIQQDIDREIGARGASHWDPTAPLSLALVEEPGAQGSYGSFMVFRKLEQNVKAFWESVQELSDKTGLPLAHAGALAVGRAEDGTPLVPSPVVTAGADANDFHYDQDAGAGLCPFQAHLRKTNPRGDVPRVLGAPAAFERARRIVRRGITYGERPDINEPAGGQRPQRGAGLLFMCFQSNLDQFVIQQEGADANGFVSPGVGVDATIGQNAAALPQTWPNGVRHTMANFVTMKGGEYFFAPSVRFLSSL